MKRVNVFDVLIHNKHVDLLRVPNDYLWDRAKAKTTAEHEDALQKANMKFFTIQQEINTLSDLKYRLEENED